jgi:DNA-binding NtrC family response regulator
LLVIEDDLSLIQIIGALLAHVRPGLAWEYVTSGEAALDLIRRRSTERGGAPYRLVVSDLCLEGDTSGFDVWQECQRLYPEMPFVMTSGLSIDRYRAAWKDQTRCPKFLPKPSSLAGYQAVLGEYLA